MRSQVDTKAALTIGLTAFAVVAAVYFHLVVHYDILFPHFFYVPIILATYWYGKKGVAVPVILISILLVTDYPFDDMFLIAEDVVRSMVMIVVGLVIAVIRDASIKWENEIERKSSQLSEAQKMASMGNWVWDIRYNELSWSDEVFEIFGRDPKTFRPSIEEFMESLHEKHRKTAVEIIDDAIRAKDRLFLEHEIVRPDGTVRTVVQRGVIKRDKHGNAVVMFGIIQDITDRMREAMDLKKANAKASLLESIFRHDMRNMLVSAEGYLDLSKKASTLERKETFIDKSRTALGRMEALIEESKDYTDIGMYKPAWNDLEEILKKFEPQVLETGRKLDIQLKGVEVFTDLAIEKVLYNLIDNSLRYADGATFIRFRLEDHGTHVDLICEDDGPGIFYEEKDVVFDKGVGKNTGYGLFFIRESLAISDIIITEEGEYGKGAKFVMKIAAENVRKK